ncbi:MAG: VOC family protein [Geminicoccaceae bacterium]
MNRHIGLVSLLVRDYAEALTFFTCSLGFDLVEDVVLNDGKRWVVVAPGRQVGPGLLLARAASDRQAARVGDQFGGRVGFFLHTDDFWRDYESFRRGGVRFDEEPRQEAYGTVAVFRDLYGNRWDLLEPSDVSGR